MYLLTYSSPGNRNSALYGIQLPVKGTECLLLGRLALRFSQLSAEIKIKGSQKSGGCADTLRSLPPQTWPTKGPPPTNAQICDLCNVGDYRFVPEDMKYRAAVCAQSRGLFNAGINFTPQHLEIDRLCVKRVGAGFQCLALGIGVAIRGDHDNWDVRPHCLRFGQ